MVSASGGRSTKLPRGEHSVRRKFARGLAAVLSLVVVGGGVLPAIAADNLVQQQAWDKTPHVRRGGEGSGPSGTGSVRAIAQVGDKIVLGGDFDEARPYDSGSFLDRDGLLAFDRTTGALEPLSLPINGIVNTLLPAGGNRVFVGGDFTIQVGSSTRSDLILVDLAANTAVASFNSGFAPVPGNGQGVVKDLKLAKGRLWVAGTFTHVQGSPRKGLTTLNPTTGQRSDFSKIVAAGTFKGGTTGVEKIDVTPDGRRLFAIGNFTSMGGVARVQFAALDINGTAAALANYRVQSFQAPCPWVGNSYPTDLDISPDGAYLVVTTTGAKGAETSLCDSISRFETGASGVNVRPSWVDHTGGDSVTAVEIANGIVYIGGHFRYLNNPHSDIGEQGETIPRDGAVAREALAALDPANGMPLDWNPTREGGVGVYDFLRNDQGLWIGSDTTEIGTPETTHARIALLPSGSLPVPVQSAKTLPAGVYVTGAHTLQADPRVLYRVDAAGGRVAAAKGISWASDTDGSPSAHRRPGPKVKKRGALSYRASNVPADTPATIFAASRLGTKKRPDQSWNFPVAKGKPVVVRLYFAKPCKCKGIGKWRQRVTIEGKRKIKKLNIAKAAGNKTGILKSFTVTPTSSNLDVDLKGLKGRSYLAAIEVLSASPVAPLTQPLLRRTANVTPAFGSLSARNIAGRNWATLRGAFMLGGLLYTAWADGSFTRQTFNGSTVGAAVPVAGQDAIETLESWKDDIKAATSLFYDQGRIYFTLPGSTLLHYRYFTPSTMLVGATRYAAAGSTSQIPFQSFRGAFLSGSKLYWAGNDGALRSATWLRSGPVGLPVASTARVVSGTNVDSNYWYGRVLFLAP